ncbi:MAG: efflux RND transporter periplasmic adaptor subunit [Pseudomonadota bacterium]
MSGVQTSVAHAQTAPLPSLRSLTGSVELKRQASSEIRVQLSARDDTTLSAEMDGRVLAFAGREGATFRKGDELVTFDCRVQRAELARAIALRKAARDRARVVDRLVTLNSASELEALSARAALEEAQANVQLSTAIVSRCVIKAPFDGSIAAEEADEHAYVTAGQPLLKIHNPDTLEAELLVPSHWLQWLAVGASFEVFIEESQQAFRARVARLGSEVDPVSQSVKIFGTLDGDLSRLMPGMSGRASFEGR